MTYRADRDRQVRLDIAAQAASTQMSREILARRVVRGVIDCIVRDVIKPGVPEVRECSEVAEELRQYAPALVGMIVAQLTMNEGCP